MKKRIYILQATSLIVAICTLIIVFNVPVMKQPTNPGVAAESTVSTIENICAPGTLYTLSGRLHPLGEFILRCKTTVNGTEHGMVPMAWKELTGGEMKSVYSANTAATNLNKFPVCANGAYYWTGITPQDLISPDQMNDYHNNPLSFMHACVLICDDGKYSLIHTLSETDTYKHDVSEEWLIDNTLEVLSVK